MSVTTVKTLLDAARQTNSQYGKELITAKELEQAWTAAKAPEASDPAGKPLSAAEAKLFQELKATELNGAAKTLLKSILAQIPGLLQGESTGDVVTLPEKRGYKVVISHQDGFVVDPSYGNRNDPLAQVRTFYDAASYLQASFGSDTNMFTTAQLNVSEKRGVLNQLTASAAGDLANLTAPQREQLLGSIAALLTELVKSCDIAALAPNGSTDIKALQSDAVAALVGLLKDERASVLVRRSLVGYLSQSDSFQAALSAPQKAQLKDLNAALFPQAPVNYSTWEASGKDRIVIDHVCGQGENFLFGFVKELQAYGVGDARGTMNKNKFKLIAGGPDDGYATVEVTIPANDPMNKWGRAMTVEVRVREFNNDLYTNMSDPKVDIVSYGGHSNFGNNTLASLRNAPNQVGDKIICRDLCCGADTKNAEAQQYAEASLNSITSCCSSYFRTQNDPQRGDYAYESEGYLMLMSLTRGILGKKSWDTIGGDLKANANWWGHDSDNNWTWPTDKRAGSFVDNDRDGIPNVFDMLPSYNTTDVAASTAKEFELVCPALNTDQIAGTRAFQAIQFLNTATNYNTVLQPLNEQRKVSADPNGLWFDGREAPKTYVRFREGANGAMHLQISSALADMTLESLRPVLYFELTRYLAKREGRLFANQAEANAMGLLFAATALEYDESYRDREVFEGLKKLYGFGPTLLYRDVQSAVLACEGRHNYTGDEEAAKAVLDKFKAELGAAGAGSPAITVS